MRKKVRRGGGLGLLCATTLAVALALAACGSSSSSGGSGSSASGNGSSSNASGSPLLFGNVSEISGAAGTPEERNSVQAYFDQINASGGVDGHKLELTSCDDQSSPSVAANCLKSLSSNSKVLAIVGNSDETTESQYDMADIGTAMTTAENLTATNVFALAGDSESGSDAAADIKYAEQKGLKKPGIIDCPTPSGCVSTFQNIQKLVESQGMKLASASAPLTAVDMTPQVLALKNAGVNFIFMDEAPSGVIDAMKAAQAIGYHPYWTLLWSSFSSNVATQLPAGTANVLVPSAYNISSPAFSQYEATMNKYIGQGKWVLSALGLTGWTGAQMLVETLKAIHGPITRASILAAAHNLTFTSPLLPGPVDLSQPGAVKGMPSVRNWMWYLNTIQNGKFVQINGGNPVDSESVVKAAVG